MLAQTRAIRTLQSTPLNETALKLVPETKSNGKVKPNQVSWGVPVPSMIHL